MEGISYSHHLQEILLRIEDKLDLLIQLEMKVDKVFSLLQGQSVGEAVGKITVKEDEQEFVVRLYTFFGSFSYGNKSSFFVGGFLDWI